MHRIDVRELNQALQSLARMPILSAFRYQRGAANPPGLSLEVKRFADAGVLAAVADRGIATTMVTSEGRALTEVSLQGSQSRAAVPKLTLPAGATWHPSKWPISRPNQCSARMESVCRCCVRASVRAGRTPCHSSTCTRALHSLKQGRPADVAPQNGPADWHRRMGGLRARELLGEGHRRQRDRSARGGARRQQAARRSGRGSSGRSWCRWGAAGVSAAAAWTESLTSLPGCRARSAAG